MAERQSGEIMGDKNTPQGENKTNDVEMICWPSSVIISQDRKDTEVSTGPLYA